MPRRYFGLRLANEAVQLLPGDLDARAALLSLSLEKAIDRVGFHAFPAQDQARSPRPWRPGPPSLRRS